MDKNPKSNQPKTNITVKREYDKNGNLVKYDSTYSYYYSNIEKDTLLRDSLLRQFKSHFNQKYFFSYDPYFNDFFFADSLLGIDFYKRDFFQNRYHNNLNRMDQLFWQMDSIKNRFFMEQFHNKKPW